MVITVVVHGNEVEKPLLPELTRLAADDAALENLPRSSELADGESVSTGYLLQVPKVLTVDDNEREDHPHIWHGGIVRPHGSKVRPRERSTLVGMHDAERIQVDERAGDVRLTQALGNRLSNSCLAGPG